MKIMGFVKDLPDKIAGVRKDHTGIVKAFCIKVDVEFNSINSDIKSLTFDSIHIKSKYVITVG